jgi:acylphosphatase
MRDSSGSGSPGSGSADAGRAAGDEARVRLTACVDGRVQGVGFRWWVRARALELGLAGWATNLTDGRVEVVAEGPRRACARLLNLLHGPATPGQVTHITSRWGEPGARELSSFVSR